VTSTKRTLRIGTRESKLARLQTDMVLAELRKHAADTEFEIVAESTSGDKVLNKPIAELGSTGVFVKELEDALLENRVDLVVHSLKDLPTVMPDELILAATLLRDDPRDVFLSAGNVPFEAMPKGSRIATSSRRRSAQLGAMRSDVVFVDVRGNVPTRLRKLDEGHCDGMVLAAAGLLRLGFADRVTQFLDPEISVPAAGQGALGVECRRDDADVIALLAKINDETVSAETRAERAFLNHLGGGCSVPIGVLARLEGNAINIRACIADGERLSKGHLIDSASAPEKLGVALAEKMLSTGADKILENVMRRPQQPISPP
jgi:hydroxymethylbilane synthase